MAESDLSFQSLDSLLAPKSRRKNPSIFVKDANLQVHVPNVGEAMNLEKKHSFKNVLASYLEDVNTLQHDSDAQIQRLVAGETENLHEVVLAMDEAQTAFDLMMQMRNQLMESYKEIKRIM